MDQLINFPLRNLRSFEFSADVLKVGTRQKVFVVRYDAQGVGGSREKSKLKKKKNLHFLFAPPSGHCVLGVLVK